MTTDRSTLRRLLLVHLGLAVVGTVALSIDPPARGWAVLVTVIVYAVALAAACRSTGHTAWFSLVGFLCLVSVFQVVPDWILSDVLGILSFPDQGGPRFDDVIPVAMGLMWVPPLFLALAAADLRPGRAALAALVVFAGSELLAPVVGLWEPAGSTARVLGVAIYVLPAEAALGWAAAVGHRASTGRGPGVKVAAAAAVSTFYTGALVVSYFVIDVADWRVTF